MVEHVRDLELAAARGREPVDDVERVRPQEVDPDGDEVALGLLGLLLEADHAAVAVELGDAEPPRIGDPVEQRAGARTARLELVRDRASAGPRRMLSPRTQQNASSPTKSRASPMAWAMPSAPGW